MFAPTMEAPTGQALEPQGSPCRSQRVARATTRAAIAGLAAALLLGGRAVAQDSPQSLDQVFRTNPRTGKVETIAGVVTESSLSKVRVERPSGDQDQYTSAEIVEIVWSSAPRSFQDGETYLGRGDFENAVAMFRSAATDSNARDVVPGRGPTRRRPGPPLVRVRRREPLRRVRRRVRSLPGRLRGQPRRARGTLAQGARAAPLR